MEKRAIASQAMPRAGANIRQLAQRRRRWATQQLTAALFALLAGTVGLIVFFDRPRLGWSLLIGASLVAISCYWEGQELRKRSRQPDRGAAGEEKLQSVLETLEPAGWQLQFNFDIQYGDIDVVARSPKGGWFVIDAKSQKGKIIWNGQQLKCKRRDCAPRTGIANRLDDFPKDPLRSLKRQAAVLAAMKQEGKVEAILCFTEARVEKPGEYKGVWVVSIERVVQKLQELDAL